MAMIWVNDGSIVDSGALEAYEAVAAKATFVAVARNAKTTAENMSDTLMQG